MKEPKVTLPSAEGTFKDIGKLGQLARQRLQEEREKRPEIVRLQDKQELIDPELQKKETKDKKSEIFSTQVADKRKKRHRRSSRHPTAGGSSHERRHSMVDKWTPDVSTSEAYQQPTSSVVMLHGLPRKLTVAEIRRFFRGLAMQRILILPPFRGHVMELDANNESNFVKKPKVDRLPIHIRVLVSFDSNKTAAMAAQQSGQPIQIDTSHKNADNSAKTIQAATIRVVHLSKHVASWLLHYMAVDVDREKRIDKYYLHISSLSIYPRCYAILWSATIAQLVLTVSQIIPEKQIGRAHV